MRTVSIFKNGNNRAIRLPRDLDFDGVSELEIVREGDSIILRPVRPTWGSFAQLDRAAPDFMAEREDVVSDEGRFEPWKKTWMLDTNICSFIMREQPAAVLKRLEQAVLRGDRIVVSAVTYAEMRFGATGPKASPRHIQLVDAFCARLDAILPWDRAAVDATTDIRVALRLAGTPIGPERHGHCWARYRGRRRPSDEQCERV
ncbi:putative DNA binding protein [Klebsiella pneumoniae]|nr:putative DNA binding protein [Klebsiella pneumoniae]